MCFHPFTIRCPFSSGLHAPTSLTDFSLYLDPPPSPRSTATTSTPATAPKRDDIKTEFHPHSRKRSQTTLFEEYGRQSVPIPPLADKEPWRPFRCQLDFEVAEFAVQNALNNDQVDVLLSLFKRSQGVESVTLKSHTEMYDVLRSKANSLTNVSRVVVPAC